MEDSKIDIIKYRKMLFIFNAIEDGWRVKKKNNDFIFDKKHNGETKIFTEEYLEEFVRKNMKK